MPDVAWVARARPGPAAHPDPRRHVPAPLPTTEDASDRPAPSPAAQTLHSLRPPPSSAQRLTASPASSPATPSPVQIVLCLTHPVPDTQVICPPARTPSPPASARARTPASAPAPTPPDRPFPLLAYRPIIITLPPRANTHTAASALTQAQDQRRRGPITGNVHPRSRQPRPPARRPPGLGLLGEDAEIAPSRTQNPQEALTHSPPPLEAHRDPPYSARDRTPCPCSPRPRQQAHQRPCVGNVARVRVRPKTPRTSGPTTRHVPSSLPRANSHSKCQPVFRDRCPSPAV